MSQTDRKGYSSRDYTSDSPSSIATFVVKIYNLLGDPQNASAICWDEGGKSFTIKNQALLTSKVLPQYFRHNNYQSFIRQLNMYSFTKLKDPLAHRFQNRYFIRQREELLKNIKRKPQKKKRRESDDSIGNEKENQMKIEIDSFKYITAQKKSFDNEIKAQQGKKELKEQATKKKVGFVGLSDLENADSCEDHISTIIEPTIRYIDNRSSSCWNIKSQKSIGFSIKLINQDQNKQELQMKHVYQRYNPIEAPIVLLYSSPNITEGALKQL